MGDSQSGQLWEMDSAVHVDAEGLPLRRERVCPFLTEHMKNIRHNQLTLDCDTGVGLDVASDQPGYDPQVLMRYSNDRGKTWGNERQASLGKIGETKTRVIFNQLGSARIGRAYELVCSDPVPLTINTAYLKLGAPEAGR